MGEDVVIYAIVRRLLSVRLSMSRIRWQDELL